ncbi:hypothetical protein F4780DRAFT_719072 [Xylariomycetidae sp. FL0641]|nr:hypothetical protein F4780DRAFT_719072 [Xylariomycetidae sp. FL0641]
MVRPQRTPSSSTSDSPSQKRLPVNHRRHKVAPENRKRVSTACNGCNLRRIKCSGDTPCNNCRLGSRECHYPTVVEKVAIPRAELEELQARCQRLERCLGQMLPEASRARDGLSTPDPTISEGNGSGSGNSNANGVGVVPNVGAGAGTGTMNGAMLPGAMQNAMSSDEEPTPSEGRLLSDPDGTARYLGATSGATFLDLLKEFIMTILPLVWPSDTRSLGESTFLGSLGRYQTSDSRPLLTRMDVNPIWLPQQSEMLAMTTRLRYFVQDGDGSFASGGIYYWGPLDPSILDLQPAVYPGTLKPLTLFQAAFALATKLDGGSDSSECNQVGESYFARARALLGNPLDTTTSTVYDIPILAIMSLYLVEMNRRDAAYMYLSLGMRIAIMHGVHRGWTDEQGKRAFWTLYVLDRWLSCLMGRPPNILDDAIRLPLPSKAPGMPSPAGLIAHVELSKISGYITDNVYHVAPWEREFMSTAKRIDKALGQLNEWVKRLPPELQLSEGQVTEDRACYELHMFYHQLLILTIRPIFFVAVKKAVAERYTGRNHPQQPTTASSDKIQQCVSAARSNLRLGRWMRDLTRKLLSGVLHNIFNAAIILLLYQLLSESIEDEDSFDIAFAIECFDSERTEQYQLDCARVLQDIRALVHQMKNNRNQNDFFRGGGTVMADSLDSSRAFSMTATPVATAAYDVGFILNQDASAGIMSTQEPILTQNAALYHELTGWMTQDDLQLYDHSYLGGLNRDGLSWQ